MSVSALVVFGRFVCFLLHHNFSCWVHRVITGRLPKKQVRIGPVRMTVFSGCLQIPMPSEKAEGSEHRLLMCPTSRHHHFLGACFKGCLKTPNAV
ncbi:hypothetical protein [Rodentibacter pneumotropicus]|uniref:hypothetical protein n=1 Tax=Rodentibacter pneumotropicus TaxID=758 RepID=UPI001863CB12|nr:hypothetical protein [Rodentibacter pneumotropicus]